MPEVRVLNVAEKPSVARALVSVFASMQGSRESRPMRREAAQIFEHQNVRFPKIWLQGRGQVIQGPVESHTMITTSVRGHLASQDFATGYGWSQCDPASLFDAPLEIQYRDDMDALARMLTNLAKQCQAVILWLDCDREGEAIANEVREVCLRANPRLKHYRAKFSTVMAPEIQRALKSLGSVNEAFVHAVQARSELDLRVGAAFSRFQTLRLQKRFSGFADKGVVSYGPCQFPTLGFIVERWARIETFQPETFWTIDLKLQIPTTTPNTNTYHNDDNNNNNNNNNQNQNNNNVAPQQGGNNHQNHARSIAFTWKRGRLYDRLLTLVLYESCLDVGEATVIQLRGNAKKKWRPVPLSTVELQKRASKYLRIGSETLMSAAEELYQNGYITYPRTETEVFRPEFQHQQLIQDFAGNGGEFRPYASKLLTANHFQLPRAGRNDDNAHPPITPCKAVDPETAITDPTQRSIYKLIVKHYLACCSRDAEGRETTLTVRIGTEDFTAKGLMVTERNWLEVYEPFERWYTQQGELPPLEVGSRIVPSSLTMNESQTTPPLLISEVELISLMDRHGIGTDATIATHISTVQERDYAVKDANQRFRPSPLGIALVEGYNSMGYQLNKPDLRREMEAECNQVASGTKRKEEVMASILEKMRQCYQRASAEATKLDEAVARRFQRIGRGPETSEVVQRGFSACGTCNTLMTLKKERSNANAANNRGRNNRHPARRKLVLYCETCQCGWGLPERGVVSPKTEQERGGPPVKCPICLFQVIQIKRGEGHDGNPYHVCPKCFSDPPLEHGGTAGGVDFRCFQCHNENCPLASGTRGGEIEVFPCPFCAQPGQRNRAQGQVKLQQKNQNYRLSCSNAGTGGDQCKYTIWLPKEAAKVEIESNGCGNCSTNGKNVKQIKFKWKPGSVPPPIDRESIVCILCDEQFRRHLGISLPRQNHVIPNARRRGGGTRGQPGRGNGYRR